MVVALRPIFVTRTRRWSPEHGNDDEGADLVTRLRGARRAVLGSAIALALASVTALAGPADAAAVTGRKLSDLIPYPVTTASNAAANFTLTSTTSIRTQLGSPPARAIGLMLAGMLRPATGFGLAVGDGDAPASGAIALLLTGADPRVGEQGYQLDVTKTGVAIRAVTPTGLFAGIESLRQLFPADIESTVKVTRSWPLPGGRIVDYPRFAYRGVMLDLARHFHTPDEVKKYIDEIAQFKVNYLHLHLTDDQGWRIQIDSWPKLATVGGGPGTGVGGVGPGYLTKAAYADLVAYAADRYITVIPEIDLPGHTNAAQATYPELNCNGVAPPRRTDTAVGYSSLCIGSETTYRFVEDVIRELAAMTPGPYLHIGGDEASATTDADYRTFMSRVLPMVATYGKTAIGWNEVTKATPPTSTIPQYWGTTASNPSVAAAAARGNKILMSPANKAYLDMKYTTSTPLGQTWAGLIEVQTAYNWDPSLTVTGVGETAVAGVEAPLWSETLRNLDNIEYMTFPRLPGIAEIGWSPKSTHNWTTYKARLGPFGARFSKQGIDYYRSPQVTWS
jgi:hexosaminidase